LKCSRIEERVHALRYGTHLFFARDAKAECDFGLLQVSSDERHFDTIGEAKCSEIVRFGVPDRRQETFAAQDILEWSAMLRVEANQKVVAVLEEPRIENYVGSVYILKPNFSGLEKSVRPTLP
jgi:hypothetical protein